MVLDSFANISSIHEKLVTFLESHLPRFEARMILVGELRFVSKLPFSRPHQRNRAVEDQSSYDMGKHAC